MVRRKRYVMDRTRPQLRVAERQTEQGTEAPWTYWIGVGLALAAMLLVTAAT